MIPLLCPRYGNQKERSDDDIYTSLLQSISATCNADIGKVQLIDSLFAMPLFCPIYDNSEREESKRTLALESSSAMCIRRGSIND